MIRLFFLWEGQEMDEKKERPAPKPDIDELIFGDKEHTDSER